MYSIKAILQKQPVAIAGGLRAILYVLILGGVLHMSVELLASIALGAEIILGLFSWSQVTPVAEPELEAGTEVKISGTEETTTV